MNKQEMAGWMGTVQRQLDSLQRLQSQWQQWPPWHLQINWKWPWQDGDRDKRRLREESERRRQQVELLCKTVKVETIADLQDLLGAMVLSECVYKKPDHDLVRAVNKFKADFGGQLVSLEGVQASLDHVPHRYVLAEGKDTLYASFIGTNHYKDVIADANVLQGAIFHEEELADIAGDEEVGEPEPPSASVKGLVSELKAKPQTTGPKPAAHRGFLNRAKGIPALEIYRLAQEKDKKLVLCGHSLGGAVAALTTLAILRVFSSSGSRSTGKVNVKCITFSQPPVGNRALRDYVHRSGWQQHFQTYCIPEDVIPRILSPAYFQHYHDAQEQFVKENLTEAAVKPGKERMALGLGPVQTSFWRLSKLVPLVTAQNTLQWLKGRSSEALAAATSTEEKDSEESRLGEPLEIREGTEGVSLVPLPGSDEPGESKTPAAKQPDWRKRMLSLPSYIPFGQLYLLEKLSVEPLPASEYTRLTSVQSVLMELRDRFRSHTMKSYRTRFKKIYEHCLGPEAPSPVFMMEHLPHLPHLRQWLGVDGDGLAEIRKISEPIVIRTATSLVPLGWKGSPGQKGSEPLRVDVQGYGLHLCTLVRAQVNGRWCSTNIETSPVSLNPLLVLTEKNRRLGLQRMRIRIGAPLSSSAQTEAEGNVTGTSSPAEGSYEFPVEGLSQVTVQCSTDFVSSTKRVSMRLRRVRLLGLEGAGKTSLYYALMGQGAGVSVNADGVYPDMEWREGVSCGVGYIDAAGVNLQDLPHEAEQLRRELQKTDTFKRIDLILLVHNLAHKIPRLRQPTGDQSRPALGTLMDEVAAADVPFVLALTNKFAVSAERRQVASVATISAYNATPESTVVVNSCPYTVHGRGTSESLLQSSTGAEAEKAVVPGAAQRLISAPINLVQMPFRRKEEVLPVEGVKNLRALVHRTLLSREEAAFEDLRTSVVEDEERIELAPRRIGFVNAKPGNGGAAAVGAAIGAGFGVLVALIMGAAATLGK